MGWQTFKGQENNQNVAKTEKTAIYAAIDNKNK